MSERSRLPGNAKILTVLLAFTVLLAAALVLAPGAHAQGSTERDRQLLTGIYFALGGAGWAESDYWLSDEPLDQWHGVTVANGRVVGLDLSGNGLTGRIPPGLNVLFDPSDFDIRLKELDLSNNQLSGQLPSGFVPLFPHLEVLKASGNQFSGPIPSDATSLSKLTWLDLDNNDFSGQIPSGFGSLSGLTVLRLGGNDFSGPIPSELGRLSNLSILGLGNNRLSGEMPAELGNLTALTRISVFGNQLEGPIPPELGKLSNLTRLSLGNNKLSGAIPAELGSLPGLEYLDLSLNQLTGRIPTELSNLSNLEHLDLWNNQLSGEIPEELAKLSNLEILYLSINQLTGETPEGLANLSRLERLHLYSNQLSGEIPPGLGNLRDLEHLSFYNNRLSGEIPAELGNLSNLELLHLDFNQFTGNVPVELGNLSNLVNLRIRGNQLTGCVPRNLQSRLDSNSSDLGGLPFCAATPLPTTPTPVPDDNFGDRAALVAIYDTMGGKEWSRQKNWKDPDIHIGEWEGVTTDTVTGRVTHLNLNGRGLTGNVPDEVVNLTALRELRLSHNLLTGEIPPWMSSNQLSSLELLNLSNNRLSGQIPVSLADLPSLTTLVLHGNQFNGCIPLALKGLVPTGLASLPEFCLSLEQQEKRILMELHEAVGSPTLTNWGKYDQPLEPQGDQPYSAGWEGVGVDENGRVKELLLAGKMLRGNIPWEQLAKLEGLEYLDLSENGLSGAIEVPHQLGPLENLYHLDLGGNTLSGEIPSQLSRFRNLRLLDLSRNQFTGAIPEELADLKNLRHDGLRLFGHKFDGCIPRELKGRLAVSYFAPRYVDPGENIVSRILDMVNVYFPDYIQSYLSQILNQEDLFNEIAEVKQGSTLGELLKPNPLTFKKIANAIPGFGSIFDVLDLLTQDWFMRWVKGSTDVTYGLGAPPCAPDLPAPATSLERQSLDSDKTALLAIRQYFIDYEKGDDGDGPVNEYDDGGENVYTFTRDDSLIGGRNFNWPAQGHVSEWHGVTVENGRVVRLEITERLLEGEIPQEVGDLGALKRLNLSRNRLSGPIPKELGNLVNLEHLSLNGKRDLCGQKYDGTNCDANRLSGEIPKSLGHLTKLKALHLHENNFEGEVPLELGNATGLGPNKDNLDQNDPKLREVNFSSSGLTGCLPPNLQGNFDTPIGARFAAYLARIVAFTALEVAIPIVGAAVSVFDYLIGGKITSLVDWATNTSANFITRQGAFHSDLGDVKLYCDPDPAPVVEPSPASGQRSPW